MSAFNKYYQDELTYLRELGHEYSQAHPALAPMLADKGGDPDVERLLEGVAFLTARIRQKLDDELPEMIGSMCSLLFPQLIRPVPGTAILELTPLANALRTVRKVPAGTEFASVPVDGTSCRFTSSTDCELCPLRISGSRFEMLSSGEQQLRIDLQTVGGVPMSNALPERLRLHLTGEPRFALALLSWILEHTVELLLVEHELLGQPRTIRLGPRSLHHVGFAEDEALLPAATTAFPGFRLLQEYYTLPAKFCFIDVEGVRRAEELGEKPMQFALVFRFDRPFDGPEKLLKDAVRLHCVPIVNVFETTAEPIRLSLEREQFLVRPAGLAADHGEVFALRRVAALKRGVAERIEVTPFLDFEHAGAQHERDRIFYWTHYAPSVLHDGADVSISIGTAENQSLELDADVLSVELLATNRGLAGALRPGEVSVPTASSPPYAKFVNLGTVTPPVPPPFGREVQWRAVAHAAMDLRSLTEPEVLRAAVSLYDLRAIVDHRAARANELRTNAIKEVRVTPLEQLYRGTPVRGVAIEVVLDEVGFAGDGDLYLFGCILDRLFGYYVSINSFSRTTVRGAQTRLQFTWPARNGSLTLL